MRTESLHYISSSLEAFHFLPSEEKKVKCKELVTNLSIDIDKQIKEKELEIASLRKRKAHFLHRYYKALAIYEKTKNNLT